MPILTNFAEPKGPEGLTLPDGPDAKLFLAFLSSRDPQTNQPWCPDVRAAMEPLDNAFSAEGAPKVAYIWVGQRPEWKTPSNVYRTKWNVHNVPTLVRYQLVDGAVKETGRLVEGELLDSKALKNLLNP